MSWVRLDDQFTDHPKVIAAGPAAAWLFVCGLGYCARYLTDGFIPAGQVRKLADVENTDSLAAKLIEVGLWEVADGGFRIHDYLGCGSWPDETPRQQWNARRAGTAPEVYARDGHRCRYCGATEDLTVDHLTPLARGGGNGLDNLAVACRSCNSAKGSRTPDEWGR